jgi:hypothetical protein
MGRWFVRVGIGKSVGEEVQSILFADFVQTGEMDWECGEIVWIGFEDCGREG